MQPFWILGNRITQVASLDFLGFSSVFGSCRFVLREHADHHLWSCWTWCTSLHSQVTQRGFFLLWSLKLRSKELCSFVQNPLSVHHSGPFEGDFDVYVLGSFAGPENHVSGRCDWTPPAKRLLAMQIHPGTREGPNHPDSVGIQREGTERNHHPGFSSAVRNQNSRHLPQGQSGNQRTGFDHRPSWGAGRGRVHLQDLCLPRRLVSSFHPAPGGRWAAPWALSAVTADPLRPVCK